MFINAFIVNNFLQIYKFFKMSDSRFVHWTLFLNAVSLLFSWNSLMGTCHFFVSKSGSTSKFVFDYLIMIFVSVRFLLLFLSSYLLTLMSPFSLVIFSSIGTVVCFILLFFLSIYEISPVSLFVIISVVVSGASSFFALTAYLGVFRFISDLPSSSYIRMMSFGFGVASVLTSVMRLGSALLFPNIPGSSSYSDTSLYFFLAIFICSLATIFFYYAHGGVERLSIVKKAAKEMPENSSSMATYSKMDNAPLKSLLGRVWLELGCLFITSLQIALVIPNFLYLTASSSSSGNILLTEQVFPLFSLFILSMSDFAGRLALKLKFFYRIRIPFWATVSMLRFLLIGLLLVGNIRPILGSASDLKFSLIPSFYASDYIYFLLVVLFGSSSGSITTMMLMAIPSSFESASNRKRITTWMVGIQSLGFLFGTFLSFGLKYTLYASIVASK